MDAGIERQGNQSGVMKFVDHFETYGSHVVEELLRKCVPFESVLDIGAGTGRDLALARSIQPMSELHAIEFYEPNIRQLASLGISVTNADLERKPLPFVDESLDVIIANQILEHTKEIFWIFHEMTRTLRVGGSLLIGVPNLVSFHNRLLAAAGRHATQHKLASAHVRPFSKSDLAHFLATCFPSGYEIESFRGSQFYPLPKNLSRHAARRFPNAAFSVFFRIVKTRSYVAQFLEYPASAKLETNFFVGVPTS
jgi:SAM-dependent methyltransferase